MTREGYRFEFDPRQCPECNGHCCTGESGHIWINTEEISAIAAFLGMENEAFLKEYAKKVWYKYSLKEIKIGVDNFACVFFDSDRSQCSVYDVRPSQCRTFPFWDHFKTHPDEAVKECPAVRLLPE